MLAYKYIVWKIKVAKIDLRSLHFTLDITNNGKHSSQVPSVRTIITHKIHSVFTPYQHVGQYVYISVPFSSNSARVDGVVLLLVLAVKKAGVY